MRLDEHRHRPLFRSLNSIFVPPANADGEFPVAKALYAETMGPKEVI